jgi:hypothetical protein
MKNALWENVFKNVLIVVVLIFTYFHIQTTLGNMDFPDKSVLGSLLVAVSILAVTACFGNFAFTYEKVEHQDSKSRYLAHMTTGLLMILIGLSLEMTSVIVSILMGNFFIFNLSLLILYLASVMYDFWDLKRADL